MPDKCKYSTRPSYQEVRVGLKNVGPLLRHPIEVDGLDNKAGVQPYPGIALEVGYIALEVGYNNFQTKTDKSES